VRGIEANCRHAALIRHAGWIFSILLAAALSLAARELLTSATRWLVLPSAVAVWLTALDAVTSDLLGHAPHRSKCSRSGMLRPPRSRRLLGGRCFMGAHPPVRREQDECCTLVPRRPKVSIAVISAACYWTRRRHPRCTRCSVRWLRLPRCVARSQQGL